METLSSAKKDKQEIDGISELEFAERFKIDSVRFPNLFKLTSRCLELKDMIVSYILYFEGPVGGQHLHFREAGYPTNETIELYERSWDRITSEDKDIGYMYKDILKRHKIKFDKKAHGEFIQLMFEECKFGQFLPKEKRPIPSNNLHF